jgi:hypothetical protein
MTYIFKYKVIASIPIQAVFLSLGIVSWAAGWQGGWSPGAPRPSSRQVH